MIIIREVNRKYCVIFPYPGIGDFIMASPFFRYLLSQGCETDLYLREDCRFTALAANAGFSSVSLFPRKMNLFSFLSFLKKLKKQHYDCSYVLREGPKYKCIAFFSAPEAFCMGSGFFKVHGHRFGRFTHFAKRFFLTESCRNLDCTEIGRQYFLNIPEESSAMVCRFLSDNRLSENRVVLLNPGSWELSKRWPLTNFIALARMFENSGYTPVFTLGPCESELKSVLSDENLLYFQSDSLNDLAALIQKCPLFVTNDTGPMHIACCTDTLLTAVISRRACQTVRPLKSDCLILTENTDCDLDCESCRVNCLQKISPEHAFKLISDRLFVKTGS